MNFVLAITDSNAISEGAKLLTGNWQILAAGIALIVLAVILVTMIKQIIVNSILGVVCWAILFFVLKVELNIIPTLVLSILFGLAGIGAILVLKFMGIAI